MTTNPTIDTLRRQWTEQLRPVCPHPGQVDAEVRLILETQLQLCQADVYRNPAYELTTEQVNQVEALLKRRIEDRVPIQYLVGQADFYGLTFSVNPAVLIPRPETELLVDIALERLLEHPKDKTFRLLDLGTGSGCIPIAFAVNALKQGRLIQVTAVDYSAAALTVAKANAAAYLPVKTIRWVESNWTQNLARDDVFDLIVSNPPYVANEDTSLRPEVKDHEPEAALFAPVFPKQVYQTIAAQAKQHLTALGMITVEFGDGQWPIVTSAFQQDGYLIQSILKDRQGLDRVGTFSLK